MFWSFFSPAVLSFASSLHPRSSSFVLFSPPLPICLKRPSMKDTHVPLWIKCVSLLLGRSDVGVYTGWSLWFTEGAVGSLCEGWGWWGLESSHPPLFKLSLMSVSHEKYLKLHKYILTCRWQKASEPFITASFVVAIVFVRHVIMEWDMTLPFKHSWHTKKLMLFLHNETNVWKAPLTITGFTGKFIFRLFLGHEKDRSACVNRPNG